MNKEVITNCCQKAVDLRIIKVSELKEYVNALTENEIRKIEKRLTPREREILTCDNMAEFGRKIDVTRERARQISESAKMKVAFSIVPEIISISERPMPDYKEVDKLIRENGIKNYQLADRIGLSSLTLSNMRKGEVKMKPIDEYAIRKVLV